MIAITGATGLLGQHLLEKFQAENIEIIALHRAEREGLLPSGSTKRQADILDQVSLREAFEGVDTLIHSAAFVSFNPRWRKKLFDVNVTGTKNVVDTCLQLGVKNLIHISSVAALGRSAKGIITEDTKWNSSNTTDYAETKYLAELEVYRGAEEGLNISMVNPSVILSASQSDRSSARLFDYVWNEKKYYTSGSLNYVDARDVAQAVLQLYKKPQPGQKYILSAGTLPFQEFFVKVAERFNKKPPSIKVSSSLSYWAGMAEEFRAFLTNSEPLVTRQSAKMAIQSYQYSSQKSQDELGIRFENLEQTLEWCCERYLRNVKSNK
ncbi:SDR family oxidoreductase [soil metagenome]